MLKLCVSLHNTDLANSCHFWCKINFSSEIKIKNQKCLFVSAMVLNGVNCVNWWQYKVWRPCSYYDCFLIIYENYFEISSLSYKQEVTGSSPVSPTICKHYNYLNNLLFIPIFKS